MLIERGRVASGSKIIKMSTGIPILGLRIYVIFTNIKSFKKSLNIARSSENCLDYSFNTKVIMFDDFSGLTFQHAFHTKYSK